MYIIDWAHATQGNASADVARTYLLFCLDNKKDLAEKYLQLFCEKTGTTKRYVQKWLPIVAASQTVKKNEEEKELVKEFSGTQENYNKIYNNQQKYFIEKRQVLQLIGN